MAAAGDEGGKPTPALVRDLPVGTRVLVDLDEGTDADPHIARGERSTDPLCAHGIEEGRCSQADRDTLASRPLCPDCAGLFGRDR